MTMLQIYLVLINALALLLMHTDKKNARCHRRRIPEKVLLGMAIAGGSLGASAGMVLFHHKTAKPRFSIGLPVILLLQLGAGLFWFA